jgi:hypothetical protein
MNYKVGQLLYYCSDKTMKIIPVQVVEEVTRVTLEGEIKKYIILLPDNERSRVNLDTINANVFSTIEEVKEFLKENTLKSIEKMANSAAALSKRAFGVEKNKPDIIDPYEIKTLDSNNEKEMQVETNEDIIMVDLGDGTKAKMSKSNLKKVNS